ncbi:hypothetical protein [Paenibacillus glycanilyticus]|nr:hypothetical protein [Paenibacillus glycanilyticus]
MTTANNDVHTDEASTSKRKDEHLDLCLQQDVQGLYLPGSEAVW